MYGQRRPAKELYENKPFPSKCRRRHVRRFNSLDSLCCRRLPPDGNCPRSYRTRGRMPSPTQPQGGQCLLRADATLTKTLRLTSDTKLNCQGHKLVPRSLGSGLSQRSVPEVAIFLNGVKNVQIQNCVIDGFDFGIFAVKSKVPAEIRNTPGKLPQLRNKILQNTVNARFLAISLASVDNTEVKDNTIKYTTMGGKGIYVGSDSDLNRIINNTVVGDIAPTPATPAVGA